MAHTTDHLSETHNTLSTITIKFSFQAFNNDNYTLHLKNNPFDFFIISLANAFTVCYTNKEILCMKDLQLHFKYYFYTTLLNFKLQLLQRLILAEGVKAVI